jgi:transglutaminase-like putative cysteine protease
MHRAMILVLALSLPLGAQAPRITPAGDPSVNSDTIYRLAVDSAKYRNESVVYLLDDGVIRVEADGRGSETYRMVIQILKEDAVEDYAEQSFGYAPGHQKLTLNWVKVVKPNGEVISDKPAQVQDSDIPAAMANPVYGDRKVRRMSLTGVAVGTIVDISYTTEETKPFLEGDFSNEWSVTTGVPVMRSRLILDVPASVTPRLIERRLNFKVQTTERGGRRTYTWATKDVPTIEYEMLAPDSLTDRMSISIALPMTWGGIAKWYAGLAKDRYAVTAPVEAKLREIVAGATSRNDTIRAVHRWVAQDIRYVSVSLGIGGYQPRAPGDVLATGFGDCKDKATLFVAALGKLGITAYPVLLSSSATANRNLPSIDQFDHAIAAVREPTGYLYTDLTSAYTPLGELPASEHGGFALVVLPDGRTEEVTLPATPVSENNSLTRIIGTLSDEGLFTGQIQTSLTGSLSSSLRAAFAVPLDSTREANLLRSIAEAFPGAKGDSLVAFNGKDLSAKTTLSAFLSGGKATSRSGSMQIFNLPLSVVDATALVSQLESTGPRRYPIDAEQIFGRAVGTQELTLTLPAGWRARLPEPVRAESPFGTYTAEYRQDGQVLKIVRRTIPGSGIHPKEKMPDLIAWLKQVSADEDNNVIILERSTTGRL